MNYLTDYNNSASDCKSSSPTAPDTLRTERRWLVHHRKVPYLAEAGRTATDSTDPANWRPFEQAIAHASRFDGIGVALGHGLVGIDLDHCVDAETGEIDGWAKAIIAAIDSYTEYSPSGTGIHILCRGELPDGGRVSGDFEIYDSGYFTFTGNHVSGTPTEVQKRPQAVLSVHSEVFGDDTGQSTAEPIAQPELSDSAILQIAFDSACGDTIRKLWRGEQLDHPSPSEADASLACHLAFYVQNATDLENLMRRSGRGRDKWNEARQDEMWLSRDCKRACETVQRRYTGTPLREGEARIHRDLFQLRAGPFIVAALLSINVKNHRELAEACGVKTDTIRNWIAEIHDAGVYNLTETVPRKRYVRISSDTLLNDSLTVQERKSALQFAAFANGGVAQVGQKALAKHRGCSVRTIKRHTKALVQAGAIESDVAGYDDRLGRRTRCNVYFFKGLTTGTATICVFIELRDIPANKWTFGDTIRSTGSRWGRFRVCKSGEDGYNTNNNSRRSMSATGNTRNQSE